MRDFGLVGLPGRNLVGVDTANLSVLGKLYKYYFEYHLERRDKSKGGPPLMSRGNLIMSLIKNPSDKIEN